MCIHSFALFGLALVSDAAKGLEPSQAEPVRAQQSRAGLQGESADSPTPTVIHKAPAIGGDNTKLEKTVEHGEGSPPTKAHDQSKVTDWMQGLSAIVQAFFAFLVGVFTVKLYQTTRKMWAVAERQAFDLSRSVAIADEANRLSRENFTADQRPWLTFDHAGPDRISLYANVLSISLQFALNNVGRVPAVDIRVGIVALDMPSGTNYIDLLRDLSETAIRSAKETRVYEPPAYPGHLRHVQRKTEKRFDQSEIDAGTITGGWDYFVLVTYRSPGSNEFRCSAAAYSIWFDQVPTYSHGTRVISPDVWSAYQMPGGNYIT